MQGRLLGKGLVRSLFFSPPSWRMILHAFCTMNSNDLLKNFPRRVEAKYFYRRIRSCGSVTCPFRKDLPRICVYRGLPLDLALPSSTGSGWHRKLLSSRPSSSQFTRSLVSPSYNLRSCLISSVMSSLISQFRDSKMRRKGLHMVRSIFDTNGIHTKHGFVF